MYILIGIEITFFGFGLCLLQAVAGLLESRDVSSPRFLFFLFNSIIILIIGLIAKGLPQHYPLVMFPFFSSLFIIGPLNLFYYYSLLYPKTKIPYRRWFHLLPALVCFFIEILFQLQPLSFKRDLFISFFNNPTEHIIIVPLVVASTHILGYVLYLLKVALFDLDFRNSPKEFRFIGSIAILVILTVLLLFFGFVFSMPALYISGSILNVFIHICLYLSTRLFPHFFESFKKEIRKKRYEKSMLTGLNTVLIKERLIELIQEEELFRDSDISLSSMADKLSLSAHQLSQLLNERMGIGFHDFVNRYRVKEAQRILRENRDANIMSVCFTVGFNSKSSFNAAFKKITGMTPREFKQKTIK